MPIIAIGAIHGRCRCGWWAYADLPEGPRVAAFVTLHIEKHPSSLPSLMSYTGPTSAFHAVDQIAEIKHVDRAPFLVGIAKSRDREVHAEATCRLGLSRLWRRPSAKRTWEIAAVSVPHWRCYLADRMPVA